MRKFLPFFFILSIPFVVFAQQISDADNPFQSHDADPRTGMKRCATDELAHERFKNDPHYRKNYSEYLHGTGAHAHRGGAITLDTGVKYIPLVFHIVHGIGQPIGVGQNITMSQIESQVRILNEDFRKLAGTNGDGSGVDTKYEFYLAQIDELGNCTDGVVRYASTHTNTTYPGTGLKSAIPNWDPSRYFNVWVVNSIGGSIIGFGTFPWDFTGANDVEDGVVVVHDVVGDEGTAASNAPYHLGRTLTHEIGHNLGMLHTFQDGCQGGSPANCGPALGSPPPITGTWPGAGDRVCDTDPVASANFGCPGTYPSSCGSQDPMDNYMDYSDDVCYSAFTQGQKERMDWHVEKYRLNLVSSSNNTGTGINGCFDHCISASSDSSSIQITNVSYASVNNSSGAACATYSSYIGLNAEVTRDSMFDISVTTAPCASTSGAHRVNAYFDWNQDSDFDDAGEEVVVKAHGSSVGTFVASVHVPANADLGTTLLRVVCTEDTAISGCGIYPVGETEDYAIIVNNNPPTIIDFYPKSGVPGNAVTIVGTKFEQTQEIRFNGVPAPGFNIVSSDTVTVTVPAASNGPITLTTTSGNDVSDSNYIFLIIPPSISFFTPDSGLAGASIQIVTANATGYTDILFNGTPSTNTSKLGATIFADVPAGATTGPITLLHPNGNPVTPNDFKVLQPLPTVQIQGAPGNICEGESSTLTFNMTGTGPYYIEYTDGSNTVALPNINSGYQTTVTLNTTTTYEVTTLIDQYHTVNGPGATKTINVFNPPIAGFTHSTNGLDVTFTNTSSGALNYEWDFGDGSGGNGVNPLHSYAAAGTYSVSLIAETNNGCLDTAFDDVTVNVLPSSISSSLDGGDFSVFPNPVNDQLNYELELTETGKANLQIISVDGKVIADHTIFIDGNRSEGHLNMNGMAAGTYILKLTTPSGQQVISKIQKK